ncbi:hypothetical protein Sste5346_008283 [Sporothrix stenoceras]|uniref:Minor tail protein n=1 Tax=Sporothrix stenoceras TaxID=5173 RepID=A0ABR3YQ08_9PEZI
MSDYRILSYSMTGDAFFLAPEKDADERMAAGSGTVSVWDSSSNQLPRAFTFGSEDGFTITIRVRIPAGVNWSDCSLIVQNDSGPKGVAVNSSHGSLVSDGVVDFPFTFNRPKPANWTEQEFSMAWSVDQEIQLLIAPSVGTDPIPIPQPVPIEAYGIYKTLPDYFTKDGIPLDLLRLFVPSSLTTGITTELQWIQWVANVCHGKQDPAGTPGQLRPDSTQHWLRYQVWNGGPSFIFEDGGNFNLDEWLYAYARFQKDKQWLTTVNCFDQAAIVETALSLGMHNGRLHWEVRRPFGYIHADLVGWGMCNNPFFETDKSIILLDDPMDDRRTPFRSHVFISISPTAVQYNRDNSVIVDACAGPVAGDLTYSGYMSECALHDGQELLFSGSGTTDRTVVGVNGSTRATRETTAEDAFTLSDLLKERGNNHPEDVKATIAALTESFANTTMPEPFNASFAINTILQPILDNTDKAAGLILDPASRLVKGLPQVTNAASGSVTDETQALGIVGNDSSQTGTYISFKITAFNSTSGDGATKAIEALQARLAMLVLPTGWEGKEFNVKVENNATLANGEANKPAKVIADTRIRVFGNIHLSLFVYKNLLVSISGNAVAEYIPTFYKILPNYASNAIQTYYINFIYTGDPNKGASFFSGSASLLDDNFRQDSYEYLVNNIDIFKI